MSFKRILCLVMATVTVVCCGSFLHASADQASDIRNQINALEQKSRELEQRIASLKKQKASQQSIVNAIQQKINNTESQIIACNNEIARINGIIAANKTEINAKNKEIAADKLTFQKRLRASYMSNTDNTARILLGAENFADYLQLAQLMKAVSSHDKQLMQKLSAAIAVLEEKNRQNEELLAGQVSLKETIAQKQAALEADMAEAYGLLNQIAGQTQSVTNENRHIESEIASRNNYLTSLTSSADIVLSAEYFIWPVPGKYGVSQQYGGAHTGVDLSSSGIAGAPVVAIADGTVKASVGNWNSSMGTKGMASYGNYVTIDHGGRNGNSYISLSAHLSRVAVSTGQSVKQGQVIGYVGTTGNSTGYHLHLELTCNKIRTNPLPYIRQQKKP